MCEDYKERNKVLLQELVVYYNIDKTITQLVDCESVFLSIEFFKQDNQFIPRELKRVLLYATINDDMRIVNKKQVKKKEILFNFGRKIIKKLNNTEIDNNISKLKMITYLTKQLKLISKVEQEEKNINHYLNN